MVNINLSDFFAVSGGGGGGSGFTGSVGFTGSQGAGFTGSQGAGFTGSKGDVGFTGSQGVGFTGSAGAGSSVTIADDTTTNATRYLGFVSATTGTATTLNVSSTKLYFNPSTGTLNATVFNSLSDENLKTNLTKIDGALAMINDMEGYRFLWKDSNEPSMGVMAQQIESIVPELVTMDEYKSVNYNGIIPILIEAIKELSNEVRSGVR